MVSIFVKDIMPLNLTYSMIPLDVSHSVVLSSFDVLHSMLDFGVAVRIPHSFGCFVCLVLVLLSLMLWLLFSSRTCWWHSKDCVHQVSSEHEFIGYDNEMLLTHSLEEAVFEECTAHICSCVFEYQQVQPQFFTNYDGDGNRFEMERNMEVKEE